MHSAMRVCTETYAGTDFGEGGGGFVDCGVEVGRFLGEADCEGEAAYAAADYGDVDGDGVGGVVHGGGAFWRLTRRMLWGCGGRRRLET